MIRDDTIVKLFLAGIPMPELGRRFHLSRQRIHQIIRSRGFRRRDGGQHIVADWNRVNRQAACDRRYLKKWGHTKAEHQRIGPATRLRFSTEKRQALYRGEDWALNFADWCAIHYL